MIHQISLAECLEQYAPPARVLNVSACDAAAAKDHVRYTPAPKPEQAEDGSKEESRGLETGS